MLSSPGEWSGDPRAGTAPRCLALLPVREVLGHPTASRRLLPAPGLPALLWGEGQCCNGHWTAGTPLPRRSGSGTALPRSSFSPAPVSELRQPDLTSPAQVGSGPSAGEADAPAAPPAPPCAGPGDLEDRALPCVRWDFAFQPRPARSASTGGSRPPPANPRLHGPSPAPASRRQVWSCRLAALQPVV